MPAGGAAAAGNLHGQDVIDLKVCMNLLKKAIVLLPLLIMLIIVLVKATLTYNPPLRSGHQVLNETDNATGLDFDSNSMSNNSDLIISDN